MNVFVVRKTATLQELALQAHTRALQTRSLSEVINVLADTHEDFQDYKQFEKITNLMWVLQDLLEQQVWVCEHLGSVVRQQQRAQEVQA
jgi:hypothetical protein